MADVSIIIVNYNVKELLEQCIRSIISYAGKINYEIIVVDNNSFDGSVEHIKKTFLDNPNLKIISSDTNLGFAKANNLGASYAAGEYLLILNPDTILNEDTIIKTLDFYRVNTGSGAVTCKLILPSGKLDLACRRSFPVPSVAVYRMIGLSKLFPRSRLFGRYNLTYLDENSTCEVDAIVGAFMLIKKEIFDKVNGFDEDYFMYGEDIDLCYRIKKAGYKNYYFPGASIIHYKGESTKKSSISYVNNFYGAMQIFVRKNLKTRFILLDLLIKISIFYRALVSYTKRFFVVYYPVLIDIVFIVFGMYIAILQRFEYFPLEAYLPVIIIYTVIWLVSLSVSGAYLKKETYSIIKPLYGILIGFFVNSAITYFFNEFAFSRVVVIRTTVNAFVLIAFWRIVYNVYHYSRKKSFFRSVKTLIIGKNEETEKFINKLRKRVDSEYDVIGYISKDKNVQDGFAGNLDNIKDVIIAYKIKHIIFAKSELSNQLIFDLMWELKDFNIGFKILSSDSELILGKSALDKIDDIYLMQIEYNINKKINIFVKRIFDIFVSFLSLFTVYPIAFVIAKALKIDTDENRVFKNLLLLPKVFFGKYSFVGRAKGDTADTGKQFLGKHGLTGLVQINYYKNLSLDEIDYYNYYYAKNQNLSLDLEILLRTISLFIFRRERS